MFTVLKKFFILFLLIIFPTIVFAADQAHHTEVAKNTEGKVTSIVTTGPTGTVIINFLPGFESIEVTVLDHSGTILSKADGEIEFADITNTRPSKYVAQGSGLLPMIDQPKEVTVQVGITQGQDDGTKNEFRVIYSKDEKDHTQYSYTIKNDGTVTLASVEITTIAGVTSYNPEFSNKPTFITTQEIGKVESLLEGTDEIVFDKTNIDLFTRYIRTFDNTNAASLAKQALENANISIESGTAKNFIKVSTPKYSKSNFITNMRRLLLISQSTMTEDQLAKAAIKKFAFRIENLTDEDLEIIAAKDGLLSYIENKIPSLKNEKIKNSYVFLLEILLEAFNASYTVSSKLKADVIGDWASTEKRIRNVIELHEEKYESYKADFKFFNYEKYGKLFRETMKNIIKI
jgi:hypothetical protein